MGNQGSRAVSANPLEKAQNLLIRAKGAVSEGNPSMAHQKYQEAIYLLNLLKDSLDGRQSCIANMTLVHAHMAEGALYEQEKKMSKAFDSYRAAGVLGVYGFKIASPKLSECLKLELINTEPTEDKSASHRSPEKMAKDTEGKKEGEKSGTALCDKMIFSSTPSKAEPIPKRKQSKESTSHKKTKVVVYSKKAEKIVVGSKTADKKSVIKSSVPSFTVKF